MLSGNRRRLGVTLSNVVAACAACALMAAVAPPSLQQMRQKMRSMGCMNNLRVCNQAFNVYAEDFGGVWIAPWDREYPAGVGASNGWEQVWPYTMVHYVVGDHIPYGEAVWGPGGWYAGSGLPRVSHSESPYLGEAEEAPQMICAEMNMIQRNVDHFFTGTTSYSYATIGGQPDAAASGGARYSIEDYPEPDRFTHAGSTLHLMDMVRTTPISAVNVFAGYNSVPLDLHMGKSNYVFCDGHVERLAAEQISDSMYQSYLRPDAPAGDAAQTEGAQ